MALAFMSATFGIALWLEVAELLRLFLFLDLQILFLFCHASDSIHALTFDEETSRRAGLPTNVIENLILPKREC